MSGEGLTAAELRRWSAQSVRAVFHIATGVATTTADVTRGLDTLHVFDTWGGDAAAAARTSIGLTRKDLDAHGNEARVVADAARRAADQIEAVKKKLSDLITKAVGLGLHVDTVANTVEVTAQAVGGPTAGLLNAIELQQELKAILAEADDIDDTLANAINMADGDASIPAIPGPREDQLTREQNQSEAFAKVFGRLPSSATDWETAAALDPNSYDPKNGGVPPNIVAGRITPQPGQGIVRGNLFIPSESVIDPAIKPTPWDNNLGDNRGFDPNATPEQSRVSFLIDYENGLVLFRQNPSVNRDTGEVKAGNPNVNVIQGQDGSVYMRYSAADPFAPGGEDLAKATVAVQGELVVQPGVQAPKVGGYVTAFPALEVYNDRPPVGGTPYTATTTVSRMYPWIDNEWGPLAGLWRTTDVGDRSMIWPYHPTAGRVSILMPSTELGSSSNPPIVRTK